MRVRYQETDRAGVVYHSNYLIYFEIGRTELLRSLGHPYRRMEEEGLLLTVSEAGARFLRPARYDDLLRIETSVIECSGARVRFEYAIHGPGDELLCRGFTVLACIDGERGSPRRLPSDLRSLLEGG
ncbi:MAG: acyl-CoA thioesterase [Planctomycetota bacterium]